MKTRNEYQELYPWFSRTPKSVMAAIAFSFAMRLSEDSPEHARELLLAEWQILRDNGIVPQKPRKEQGKKC